MTAAPKVSGVRFPLADTVAGDRTPEGEWGVDPAASSLRKPDSAASLPTESRTTYLGGSDIGAIAGLSPYRTELDVWGAKTLGVEQEASPEMEAGTVLEAGIVDLYLRRRGGIATVLGTLRDPRETWIGATPDRVVRGARGLRNVQCKLVGLHGAGRWGDPEDGPDGVPADVLAQVAWESHVLRSNGVAVELSEVAALIGTDLRIFEVPTDEEFVDALRTLARAFWHGHVLTKKPPEVTEGNASSARDVLTRLWPSHRRPLVDATPEQVELAREYDRARAAVKAAETTRDLVAARLQLAINDSEGFATADKSVRATWKTNASGGCDWKALGEALATPEQIKAFEKPGARVLRVTVKED